MAKVTKNLATDEVTIVMSKEELKDFLWYYSEVPILKDSPSNSIMQKLIDASIF